MNIDDLFGYSAVVPRLTHRLFYDNSVWNKAYPAPPVDPFELERRWIVSEDGTTYAEYVAQHRGGME